MADFVHPVEVKVTGPHRMWLRFDDGSDGEVDMSRDEWRGVFEPLRDPEYFAQVRVDHEIGTIAWPNGADIAPETLHAWARGPATPERQESPIPE